MARETNDVCRCYVRSPIDVRQVASRRLFYTTPFLVVLLFWLEIWANEKGKPIRWILCKFSDSYYFVAMLLQVFITTSKQSKQLNNRQNGRLHVPLA